MITRIFIPKLDANTIEARIVEWYKRERSRVVKGDLMLAIETDKAVIDIESEVSGVVLKISAQENEHVPIPSVVGLAGDSIEELDSPEFSQELERLAASSGNTAREAVPEQREVKEEAGKAIAASPAARRVAREKGIDLAQLKGTGVRQEITVSDVMASLDATPRFPPSAKEATDRLRVLVVGAGNGGKIISELLALDPTTEIVGFVDDNRELWGQDLAGHKVFGGTDQIVALSKQGVFDHIIVSITSNMAIRRRLFQECRSLGFRLINVVHPSASISPSAEVGCGNIICANVHIGTETKIGDNNLISAHCSIDHHNVVGHHNLFGPGCLTSGSVAIGSDCIFGAGVCVEPRLRIGDGVRVASGSAISCHIPDGLVMKSRFSIKGLGTEGVSQQLP